MGIFSRRPKTSTSPYACEQAMESTSSFGSISCTPGAASRAFLPLTDEPESTDSTLSAASYSNYNLSALLASGPPSPSPDSRARTRSRSRPRLHAFASHHNLSAAAMGTHPRNPPPLPSLPAYSHSASYSQQRPPTAFTYHYVPTKSTPNLVQPGFLAHAPSQVGSSPNANANASRSRGLGGNKEASASRVSLAKASAGRSLARVPSLWKSK